MNTAATHTYESRPLRGRAPLGVLPREARTRPVRVQDKTEHGEAVGGAALGGGQHHHQL